jgi:multiple sugar transport system permease protein
MDILKKLRRSESLAFYLFISPWLIGFFGLTLGPMLFSLYASFTKWDGVHAPQLVGLTNFTKMFTADPDFYPTIGRTFYYAGGRVILGVGLALVLATLINQKILGKTVFRAIYYLPTVVTGVPVYIVWSWMFDPNSGIFNYLFSKIGIQGPLWLASPSWAMPALIVMSLTATGGAIVIFLAGLQGIPKDLYEAASVDGAGFLTKFWHVTIPMLSPVILFNVILGIIGGLQVFAEPFVMTGGGPVHATYVYGLYLYDFAFQYFNFGYASGLAWVLFVITIVLSLLVLLFSRGRVFYTGGEAR